MHHASQFCGGVLSPPHSKCWTLIELHYKRFSCSKNPGSQARSPKGVRQRFFPHLPPTHNSRCLCSVGAQWGRKAWKGACSPKQDQRRRGRRLRPRRLSPFRVVIQARLQQKKQEQPPEEVPGRQGGRRQGGAARPGHQAPTGISKGLKVPQGLGLWWSQGISRCHRA